MFSKLALLAAIAAPLASALTLNIPTNPTSGGNVTITWSSAPNDPATFSLELVNTAFHNSFAISNNVNPTAETITLTLPIVPVGDGYSLQAVDVGNITNVFASTGDFAIGATTAPATPSSTSSHASTVSALSSTPALSGVTSSTPSALSTPAGISSNIVSPSSTAPATSSSSSALPSTTNISGAVSHFGLGNSAGGIAVVVLSAIAGAALLTF